MNDVTFTPHIVGGLNLDAFTGYFEITVEPHGPSVTFFVSDGIVTRSVPALKRFARKPATDAIDWYTRHPEYTIAFHPTTGLFSSLPTTLAW